MTKRVLLVDIARSFGGAESRVLSLAQGLIDDGVACEIAVLAGGMLQNQATNNSISLRVLQSGRGSPKMLFELRDLMRAGRYDVVDAHNVQSILWGMWAARLAGVPRRIATIHSDFVAEYPGMKGTIYASVLNLTQPVISHTIAVTSQLAQQAQSRGAAATYIPNAVSIPEHPMQERDHQTAWGFDHDDFVIGIVGRVVLVKGHHYLIDALAQLDDLPHVKLVVVGTGSLEDELKTQADKLGLSERVRFLGFQENVIDVMRRIDCLCVPSLSEALPYVVLEAASCALPLVCTRVGGLNTLLTDGETALMIDPENAKAIAAAIRTLVEDSDLAHQMGVNAYEMVTSQFSVPRMVADTLRVYEG